MSFNIIGLKDGHKRVEFVRLASEARRKAATWREEGLADVHVVSCEGTTVSTESLTALERGEPAPWHGKTAA